MCQIEKGDSNVFKKLRSRKFEGNIGEAVDQEETLCDEVETVRKLAYLGEMFSADGGCEVVETARTRC